MLGTGVFAVVYGAYDPVLGIEVAVKVLSAEHASDPETAARFTAEARKLQSLSDERVVTVHDIGEFEGRPYLAMERIDGGTLADRLSDDRTLAPDDVDWLIDGLGAAIVVVHAAGHVHRGITPGNVLIRRTAHGDQLVLADFGIGDVVDQRRRATASSGADGFIAPEQRRAGLVVDGRADVHAASAVVGRATFGDDWRRIMVPHGPHGVTALEPPGTEPLAFELRRGLAIDPRERHASISEWTQALQAAASEHAAVIASGEDARPRRGPVVRLVAGALVVLAMVLAAATISGTSDSNEDRPPITSPDGGAPGN